MGSFSIAWRILPPAGVILAFCLHWLSIRRTRNSTDRLVICRGAYIGLSAQLLAYAWLACAGGYGSAVFLIPLGMTASFAGDFFNLQYPSARKAMGEPLAWGIACFMVAQLCYIAAFLSIIPLVDLVSRGAFIPVFAIAVILPPLGFRLRAYSRERPRILMILGFAYACLLGAMAAVAISSAIARGGAWISVAAGAALFLISDSAMGETTIAGRHPVWEYQVPWMTYLAAQGLILFGSALAVF